MSDMKTAIMDAAEKRIRSGGFGGFSFREVAADVGVKSSSVHYHFPTKDDLAAAVIRRWREKANGSIDREMKKTQDPVLAWTNVFKGTAHSKAHICPCTALAAASQDLPTQVATEVRSFWKMCQDRMVDDGIAPKKAAEVLATITGALVLANAFGDGREFDRATSELSS